jgi:putative endonuclease
LKLITSNYRCRLGEIDLILQDKETLVFVEVRMRNNPRFGGAVASIDARKQTKLIHTAQHYLATLKHIPPCRFDAVLLSSPANIEWLKNAFEA